MEIRNCKRCGKLHYGTGRVCPECLKKEEEKFDIVKKYLKENPASSLIKVSDETGVTVPEIERFLRDGRLEVTSGMGDFLKCTKCGSPIKTGRYCPECEKKVVDMLKQFTKLLSPLIQLLTARKVVRECILNLVIENNKNYI